MRGQYHAPPTPKPDPNPPFQRFRTHLIKFKWPRPAIIGGRHAQLSLATTRQYRWGGRRAGQTGRARWLGPAGGAAAGVCQFVGFWPHFKIRAKIRLC